MEEVMDLLSKFKSNLDNIIVDYRDKISDIEKEEDFIQVLGDLINYSKSDYLLLPFYDETMLSRVFERVFPLSTAEINKLKTAKYLIDASKDIDKEHFPQYNAAVAEVKEIDKKLNKYYDKLLSNDKLASDKEDALSNVEKFSKIFDIIGDDKFTGLIDDVDAFEEAIGLCKQSDEDINILLNVAIKSNLEFLDSNGVVVDNIDDDIKEENSIFQDKISDLSNLLGDEQEVFMKLKNYLVNLLSNIIHDRLQTLSDTKEDMKKTVNYKKVEDVFSNVDSIVDADDEFLRSTLSEITDEDNVNEIISSVDMIKIVLKGKNEGLDLSIDDSQEELIKHVYDLVNNYRVELEAKNQATREYLEEFISKCKSLSSEIGTGVVRDIDTLDEIFTDNDVDLDDVIKAKYEILRNNSKNYNTKLEGKVTEEVEVRILLKKLDVDFDSFSDLEKSLIVNRGNSVVGEIIDYIASNNIKLSNDKLFMLLLLSDINVISSINETCESYDMSFDRLMCIPGIFVASGVDINSILDSNRDDKDYSIIEKYQYIEPMYDLFMDNISLLEAKNISVSDCYKHNMLSLIVPDLSKNITILSELNLSNKDFSIVVINPFLATSLSSFNECGLSEYISSNPLRLTTSYYRLKIISSNIITARKNGQVIFRSLSDKKNYWLTRSITRKSEVI